MRFVLEVWDRYFQMESGRIVEDTSDQESIEIEEEAEEVVRLPLGFQAPLATVEEYEDDEDEESATPEADCG